MTPIAQLDEPPTANLHTGFAQHVRLSGLESTCDVIFHLLGIHDECDDP